MDKAYALVYSNEKTAKQYYDEFTWILHVIAEEHRIDKETIKEIEYSAKVILALKTELKGYDNKTWESVVDRFIGEVFDLYDQLIK